MSLLIAEQKIHGYEELKNVMLPKNYKCLCLIQQLTSLAYILPSEAS